MLYPHSRTWLTRIVGGNVDRRLSYQHIRGVLAYAYDLGDGWSVGVGLHGSVSRLRTDHLTLSFSGAEANHEWNNALGAGFGAGLYKKWDRWAWGLNYTSRHWTESMDDYGDLLRNALDTPRTLQTGLAGRPPTGSSSPSTTNGSTGRASRPTAATSFPRAGSRGGTSTG